MRPVAGVQSGFGLRLGAITTLANCAAGSSSTGCTYSHALASRQRQAMDWELKPSTISNSTASELIPGAGDDADRPDATAPEAAMPILEPVGEWRSAPDRGYANDATPAAMMRSFGARDEHSTEMPDRPPSGIDAGDGDRPGDFSGEDIYQYSIDSGGPWWWWWNSSQENSGNYSTGGLNTPSILSLPSLGHSPMTGSELDLDPLAKHPPSKHDPTNQHMVTLPKVALADGDRALDRQPMKQQQQQQQQQQQHQQKQPQHHSAAMRGLSPHLRSLSDAGSSPTVGRSAAGGGDPAGWDGQGGASFTQVTLLAGVELFSSAIVALAVGLVQLPPWWWPSFGVTTDISGPPSRGVITALVYGIFSVGSALISSRISHMIFDTRERLIRTFNPEVAGEFAAAAAVAASFAEGEGARSVAGASEESAYSRVISEIINATDQSTLLSVGLAPAAVASARPGPAEGPWADDRAPAAPEAARTLQLIDMLADARRYDRVRRSWALDASGLANPAIWLGLWLTGKCNWARFISASIAQALGTVLGMTIARSLLLIGLGEEVAQYGWWPSTLCEWDEVAIADSVASCGTLIALGALFFALAPMPGSRVDKFFRRLSSQESRMRALRELEQALTSLSGSLLRRSRTRGRGGAAAGPQRISAADYWRRRQTRRRRAAVLSLGGVLLAASLLSLAISSAFWSPDRLPPRPEGAQPFHHAPAGVAHEPDMGTPHAVVPPASLPLGDELRHQHLLLLNATLPVAGLVHRYGSAMVSVHGSAPYRPLPSPVSGLPKPPPGMVLRPPPPSPPVIIRPPALVPNDRLDFEIDFLFVDHDDDGEDAEGGEDEGSHALAEARHYRSGDPHPRGTVHTPAGGPSHAGPSSQGKGQHPPAWLAESVAGAPAATATTGSGSGPAPGGGISLPFIILANPSMALALAGSACRHRGITTPAMIGLPGSLSGPKPGAVFRHGPDWRSFGLYAGLVGFVAPVVAALLVLSWKWREYSRTAPEFRQYLRTGSHQYQPIPIATPNSPDRLE
ncbi:hypothetical protein H696_03481 [Fonticula alba]|uniref:Uncharacterized protein n=1 Tax=Fonticula alba TaxID=691883 RepID=A0A058Z6W4_FONAL|nr:hypothetical protein H696_03481 [Fonticula alba]KCV70014.1 hypothetical protein H696_03481 [Fonticula alba]|eukprot:XP_009495620.1 hypothetical protein H696_03481 [Fonticula alba]